ncbi:hypothetical protein [Cupriavidus malaysiensis]|uniref:Transmembrane protein n=1 Tax=Cupriavidus malaysiensis TaxID=367825 RepID=A0ABN4TV46_9BURK|nr:hypothetical protein [Cupriavidus malaysiensis]AOZ11083.1 hypothetical protein BKK80_34550 [Cupriavidus malaysiensis]
MNETLQLYVTIGAILLVIALLWGPLRMLVHGIFSILTPPVIAVLKTTALWMIWLLKKVVRAHLLLLKNLLTPHSIIFPTLRDDQDREM